MILLKEEEQTAELILSINDKNTLTKDALLKLNDIFIKWKSNRNLLFAMIASDRPVFFSNGLDPDLFLDKEESVIRENVSIIIEMSLNFFSVPCITLCLINGHCVGAAALLALYADYRYAANSRARFGFPEVHIGMNFPSFAYLIMEAISGRKTASSCLLEGTLLKPEAALEAGFLHEIMPLPSLYDRASILKKNILSSSPLSIRSLKSAMIRRYEFDMMRLKELDIETTVQTILTKETQEGFRRLQNAN